MNDYAASLSSLDLKVSNGVTLDLCPKRPFELVCRHCGLVTAAPCGSYKCSVCAPKIVRQKMRVVAAAKPERFITLTQAPAEWKVNREKMKVFLRGLRRQGFAMDLAWTSELTKKGVRHIHGLQHGDYVPQAKLQNAWGSIVDVRRIGAAGNVTAYAMKEAIALSAYVSKSAVDLDSYLQLNGGRPIHTTRGYLRGETFRSAAKLLSGGEGHLWEKRLGIAV